jgi:hypothetical protein
MILPFPHEIYDDVTAITPAELRRLGVRGLLLDIDGTLARTKDPAPSEAVSRWLGLMRRSGVALYVLSNNKSPARTERFAQMIGCSWRHRSRKPARRGFLAAAEELGLRPEELAIVGDQIWTDVLGGLRCNMKTLMVQSTDTYLWYFPLRRLVELPFRRPRR